MTSTPFYEEADVERLLDRPGCRNAVREAMKALSASDGKQPLRTILPIREGGIFAIMPGELCRSEVFGVKSVTAFDSPATPGRAAHRGVVTIFDRQTGKVLALADAGAVTELRTAAASAVATQALARPASTRLAIMGNGAQAASHVRALADVMDLESVMIWGRSFERAGDFAATMHAETGLPVEAVRDARDAAANADVICTVSSAAEPILLGEWVRPGTHVNVVGSSYAGPVEVDDALVARSRYIADSRRSVLAAGAEFLLAKERGLIGDDHIVAEIGEVLLGRVPGRRDDREITLYKSLGHIVQDLAAVRYMHGRQA